MASVRSTWADDRIVLGGALTSREWSGAGRMPIPAGFLMVRNDADYLYVALDMVGDRGRDAGTGDYFWFGVDVDGNAAITPYHDLKYGVYPGEPNRIARSHFVRPSTWTQILSSPTDSQVANGFGPSPNSSTHHRVWEMRLDLDELGVDLAAPGPPPVVRFGVRVSSTTPRFTFDYPANFHGDFTNLHEIVLARTPGFTGRGVGSVIGGIGLIPTGAPVLNNGYATTDASYSPHVVDAAFGSTLNFIGNRATLQSLWSSGARSYEILHRPGTSGSWQQLLSSWSNYRWNGTQFVLEHFGPDGSGRYPMTNPGSDYSIDDLLIRWNSVGQPAGLHQFRARFFNSGGTEVAAPSGHEVTLRIDNNRPTAQLEDILHDGSSVAACAIENMTSASDGVQLRITAADPEGHLRAYSAVASWGNGQSTTVADASYTPNPAKQWTGVTNLVVPSSEWTPPTTCAYQFRVNAWPRVTNGYNWLGRSTDTRHVTLIKPAGTAAAGPLSRFEEDRAFGLDSEGSVEVEAEAPTKLGDETPVG